MKHFAKFIIVTVGFFSGSAMALTKQECIEKKGDWKQVIGKQGICTFEIDKIIIKQNGNGDIENITKAECEEMKGTIGADGKCRVPTKNIAKSKIQGGIR